MTCCLQIIVDIFQLSRSDRRHVIISQSIYSQRSAVAVFDSLFFLGDHGNVLDKHKDLTPFRLDILCSTAIEFSIAISMTTPTKCTKYIRIYCSTLFFPWSSCFMAAVFPSLPTRSPRAVVLGKSYFWARQIPQTKESTFKCPATEKTDSTADNQTGIDNTTR